MEQQQQQQQQQQQNALGKTWENDKLRTLFLGVSFGFSTACFRFFCPLPLPARVEAVRSFLVRPALPSPLPIASSAVMLAISIASPSPPPCSVVGVACGNAAATVVATVVTCLALSCFLVALALVVLAGLVVGV